MWASPHVFQGNTKPTTVAKFSKCAKVETTYAKHWPAVAAVVVVVVVVLVVVVKH